MPVDTRIGRGRTYRDALRRLLDDEHVDRVIVPATVERAQRASAPRTSSGCWSASPAEVVILRPDPEDRRKVTSEGVTGHF